MRCLHPALFVAGIWLFSCGAASAQGPAVFSAAGRPTLPRVRSSSPSLAALVIRATKQSITFRGLIETISASDGIVYIEMGECGHDVTACLVGVTTAGAYRMLWIRVDKDKSECDLIASIGHELRHATEILIESDVRSSDEMYLFIRGLDDRAWAGAFETSAATNADMAVRSEIPTCETRKLPSRQRSIPSRRACSNSAQER